MKSNPLFWYWEAEIPKNKCQQIIDSYFIENQIEDGLFEKNNKLIRDDAMRKNDIVWVKHDTELFELIFTYISAANKQSWDYDLSGMDPVQLGRYEIGGHYQWHIDYDKICSQGFQRKLSCSVQLTDENKYEGGELILQDFVGDEEFKMPKKQGSIVVFPSMVKHKITPVTLGTRFSAVSWMRGPAFK